MGGFLTAPNINKQSDHGKGLGLRYGLCSMQGWRPEMEDAHDLQVGLKYGLHDWSFFGVFDGHAGKETSNYISRHLLDHILTDGSFALNTNSYKKTLDVPDGIDKKLQDTTQCELDSIHEMNQAEKPKSEQGSIDSTSQDRPTSLIKDSDECEPKFKSYPIDEQIMMVRRAIKSGFLRIDKTMLADKKDMSGSTAICAFISPTHLFIANCGDSRAVLSDGKKPRFASIDHKPLNPTERRRIINAGGTATDRVNGTLAVSRSLGDFEFKNSKRHGPCEQLVSPEPEITVIERQPTDHFLVLACDGIWDVMNNDEMCEFVEYNLKIESNLEKICSSVLDACLRRGSRDNMSIIIVVFENAPTVNPEFIEKVKKKDEILCGILEKMMIRSPECGFSTLMQNMEQRVEEWETPPGVGLVAKYDLLREKYDSISIPPTPMDQPDSEEKKRSN